mmetsp:Transcript_74582/g.218644  ORF Transcript_74582/g.218644 Transcript_74582/m.218644 type:complete len:220 (+) Transcript_74582:125-784(+)
MPLAALPQATALAEPRGQGHTFCAGGPKTVGLQPVVQLPQPPRGRGRQGRGAPVELPGVGLLVLPRRRLLRLLRLPQPAPAEAARAEQDPVVAVKAAAHEAIGQAPRADDMCFAPHPLVGQQPLPLHSLQRELPRPQGLLLVVGLLSLPPLRRRSLLRRGACLQLPLLLLRLGALFRRGGPNLPLLQLPLLPRLRSFGAIVGGGTSPLACTLSLFSLCQ